MRFYCESCRTSMDDSLVNQKVLKTYRTKEIGLNEIPCPFCKHKSLVKE